MIETILWDFKRTATVNLNAHQGKRYIIREKESSWFLPFLAFMRGKRLDQKITQHLGKVYDQV